MNSNPRARRRQPRVLEHPIPIVRYFFKSVTFSPQAESHPFPGPLNPAASCSSLSSSPSQPSTKPTVYIGSWFSVLLCVPNARPLGSVPFAVWGECSLSGNRPWPDNGHLLVFPLQQESGRAAQQREELSGQGWRPSRRGKTNQKPGSRGVAQSPGPPRGKKQSSLVIWWDGVFEKWV